MPCGDRDQLRTGDVCCLLFFQNLGILHSPVSYCSTRSWLHLENLGLVTAIGKPKEQEEMEPSWSCFYSHVHTDHLEETSKTLSMSTQTHILTHTPASWPPEAQHGGCLCSRMVWLVRIDKC